MSSASIDDGLETLSIDDPTYRLTLNALPTEIQDLIFHHVVADSTREELKQFRQSNRYFRDRADIYLFATLHISASNLSLERVRCISEDSRINAHVKELVYHRGTFSGHKMVKFGGGTHMQPRDYDDYETYVVRNRDSQPYIMQVSKHYDAFLREVEAEALFNREMSWRTTMKKYCARFPKLDKLTTLSDKVDLESSYLRRMCALTHQVWTPNYFAPYEIFESCGPQFRPAALSLDNVNGEDFASIMTNIRGGTAAIQDRFSQLRTLKLSFSETVTSLETEGTYDVFVRSCTNLRDLSLDFMSFYSPKMLVDPVSFPQTLIRLVLQQHYPQLAELALRYPIMTEQDFILFLERHQDSLTTLNLHRWPMPVTADHLPTGSTIRSLWKIGRLPMKSLRSVGLTGEFSNRWDGDGWSINAHQYHSRNRYPFPILAKLVRYLESTGENKYDFPIPIPGEMMQNAKTGEALSALDRIPYNELDCSDPTFEWWEHRSHDLSVTEWF